MSRPETKVNIPPSLPETLKTVRKRIAKYKRTNLSEAATQTALINPVLGALGWSLEDPEQVRPQFRPDNTNPVDYALFLEGQAKKPIALVEAKALDKKLDGFANQFMGYAAISGAPWVVLTNGDEYRIYYARGDMGLDERQFHTVRLMDPTSPTEETLALLSRESIGDLERTWDQERVDRQVRAAIKKLFHPEPHSRLLAYVRKEVKGLSKTQIKASVSRVCTQIGFGSERTTSPGTQVEPPVETPAPTELNRTMVKCLKALKKLGRAATMADIAKAAGMTPLTARTAIGSTDPKADQKIIDQYHPRLPCLLDTGMVRAEKQEGPARWYVITDKGMEAIKEGRI
jgi:hypothetical protein